MKHIFALCAFLSHAALLNAQGTFRDPDNDMTEGSTVYRADGGQLLTTTGAQLFGMAARSEGPKVAIYCGKSSAIHYVWRNMHADSGMADTSFNISMSVSGEMAAIVTPEPLMQAPGVANYYHGTTAISGVPAYHAYQYANVNPNTDMRVYHGRSGPKLAVIFNPGSDPDDFYLAFDGQDSLKVDVQGTLKLYIKGRYIRFDQAMAYQIDNGEVVPVNWVPEYITYQGQSVVHFTFDTYDPELPLVLRVAPAPPPPPFTPADPRNLGWSTYAGSDQGDEFMATGVDNDGDAYFCGYTNDMNFPVGTGYQEFAANTPSFQGNHDAVVMKFNHASKRIAWATYLGGSEGTIDFSDVGIDQATDLAVYRGTDDELDYVFVTGSTGCNDFPEPHFGGTPFQNAVHDDWGNTTSTMIHAAFIAAFKMTNGQMHWGNSLGAGAEGFWTADGMGVDVNEEGTLVWCGRLSQVSGGTTFDFNPVTPTGAFTQAGGGGFFVQFDADYDYEWKTPFGTQCTGCGAFDVKLQSYTGYTFADIAGTTTDNDDAPIFSLDIATPDNFNGFQQATHGGGVLDAYFARLDLVDHVNYYSTYWGGDGEDHGTGLVSYDKRIWLVGGTSSGDLDATHLPGNTGVHDATSGGGMDCFMLKFAATNPPPILDFGSLYGEEGDELWLDIAYSRNTVFFFGETTSDDIISFPDNPVLFRQDVLGNDALSSQRDAVLLAIDEGSEEPTWNSLIGGFWTDRGWGIAASFDELYLCGGTRSDQTTFPLLEWNTGAPDDWFDGDLLNNIGGDQGWYSNNSQGFNQPYQSGPPPYEMGAPQTHDGFAASFYAPETVGFTEPEYGSMALHARLMRADGLWSVLVPEAGQWSVFDAAGRLVSSGSIAKAGNVAIDLSERAKGTYALHSLSRTGISAYTKLFVP